MKAGLILSAALCLIGCDSPPPSIDTSQVRTAYLSPGASIAGVAWLTNEELIASLRTPDGYRLKTISVGGGEPREFGTPPTPSCGVVDDLSPALFADHVYWLRACTNGADRSYQVLRRIEDGSFETVSDFSTGFPVGPLAIADDMIVVAYGSRICETIIRLLPSGFAPIGVHVEGPGGSFSTGGDVRDECDWMGISEYPAILNGRIAFLASTAALAHSGISRLDQPMDAFVFNDGDASAARLSLDLVDPGDLEWLDAATLVASGDRDGGQPQTVRVDVDTGGIDVLLPFVVRSIAMSPDGVRIAALRTVAGDAVSDEIVTFPRFLLDR